MSLLGVVDALTPRRPRGRLGRMPEPEAAEIDVSARIRAQTRVGVVLVTDGGVDGSARGHSAIAAISVNVFPHTRDKDRASIAKRSGKG